MRTYERLSHEEQAEARGHALSDLMRGILEGAIRFSDDLNGDDLQARIDAARQQAEDMQTPWFAHEYILDDEVVRDALEGMALSDAQEALYPAPETLIIRLERA